MSENDKELLELAAKAVGIETNKAGGVNQTYCYDRRDGVYKRWDPLADDGDALRLAVDLDMDVSLSSRDKEVTAFTLSCGAVSSYTEAYGNDKHAATRRAIVRAAAAIGEAMQ